jgi:predicted TPR repeat methyltransferase
MLILSPSVLLSTAADGYVAYDLDLDRLYRLNPTAALAVELCDGTRGVAQLKAELGGLVGDDWPNWRAWLEQALHDRLLYETTPATVPVASERNAANLAQRADELQSGDRVLAAFICQQRARELAPDDPGVSLRLGELAHIVGRRDDARSAYQHYLSHCPDDAEIAHLVTALSDAAPPSRVSDRCIKNLYARFAGFYDENMVGDLEYCAPQRLHRAAAGAVGVKTGLRVLDLGCGTGLNGAQWRAQAGQLMGIDLSAPMIAKAAATGLYDRLEVAEITAWLRGTTRRFDVVVACDTLIYFGDLTQVLEPARTCVKPGGVVTFSLERGEHPPYRLSDSGRFTHHRDYVSSMVSAARLTLVRLDETVVRYEYGQPVNGLLAVCQR